MKTIAALLKLNCLLGLLAPRYEYSSFELPVCVVYAEVSA